MSSIRDFVPLQKLGEGSYSNVYKVRRQTDQQIYALKKVKMNQLGTKQRENALTEIRILASLDSQHIVSYKQAFFDQKLQVLCIVMEFADAGDVLQIIEQCRKNRTTIPQGEVWRAAEHILKGLNDLHGKGIIHRDLKSANIFKAGDTYKLGDLNVSKVNGGKLARTQTGTPYYASPEVWRDEPYDAKCDIWSFGCIIYEMVALKPPFEGKDLQELFKTVQTKPVPTIPSIYSKELADLLLLCLQKKAISRPSAQQLLADRRFAKRFNRQQQPSYINSTAKQKLLQTIKLPTDLKHLKQRLPSAKYLNDSAQQQQRKRNQPKEVVTKTNRSPKVEMVGNKSDIYRSPSSRIHLKEYSQIQVRDYSQIYRSPQIKQDNCEIKHSDRLYFSDKKNANYVVDAKFNSPLVIPRTEKVVQKTRSKVVHNLQGELTELRKKLLRKQRIFSGNPVRRSWWN